MVLVGAACGLGVFCRPGGFSGVGCGSWLPFCCGEQGYDSGSAVGRGQWARQLVCGRSIAPAWCGFLWVDLLCCSAAALGGASGYVTAEGDGGLRVWADGASRWAGPGLGRFAAVWGSVAGLLSARGAVKLGRGWVRGAVVGSALWLVVPMTQGAGGCGPIWLVAWSWSI